VVPAAVVLVVTEATAMQAVTTGIPLTAVVVVATSRAMSATTATRRDTGPVSAARRKGMRKLTSLFMASATIIKSLSVQPYHKVVQLIESRLFIQLGENDGRDGGRWILDSGATNHMAGVQTLFSEIDLRVHCSVHFGDGSVTNIDG
jgi:hypothetical protein